MLPETTRLAKTIQAWWPAIMAALTNDVSNAHTEGFNRVIKQTKRVGCGYRSNKQLPAPYPQPHRSHPTAKISSMNGNQPRSNSKSRHRQLSRPPARIGGLPLLDEIPVGR